MPVSRSGSCGSPAAWLCPRGWPSCRRGDTPKQSQARFPRPGHPRSLPVLQPHCPTGEPAASQWGADPGGGRGPGTLWAFRPSQFISTTPRQRSCEPHSADGPAEPHAVGGGWLGPGLALHPPPGRVPLYSSALNAEFEADSSFLFSQQQRGLPKECKERNGVFPANRTFKNNH